MMTDTFGAFLWLMVALGLGAYEAFTIQLVAIWFAIGALVSMIPAILGASFTVQFCTFVAVSVVLLAVTRPIVKKKLTARVVATNAKSVIGMVGHVIVDIDSMSGEGRVMVNNTDWSARCEENGYIPAGEEVLVKDIQGVKLIVERIV